MSARFSKPELQKGNLLACPFWKSDPDRYKSQNNCHPDEGFPSVARVSEHVWRCHAPLTQCEYCGRRWSWQGRAEKVMQSRARHVPECQAAHNGELRRVGYGEPEIMTADQQEAFRRVRTLRKPEHKFSELYLALGKPLPETYHVRPLFDSGYGGSETRDNQQPDADTIGFLESSDLLRPSELALPGVGMQENLQYPFPGAGVGEGGEDEDPILGGSMFSDGGFGYPPGYGQY